MAALQNLESLRNAHPELAEWDNSLADLYQRKLWHLLILRLEQFVALAVFQHNVIPQEIEGKEEKENVFRSELSSTLSFGLFEELNKAQRMVLDPPCEVSNLIPGDVLWSDPSMDPGLSLNELKGAGLLWGPDCTEEFLKKFQLKLIIRSHEGPDARKKRPGLGRMDNGFTIDHVAESGKLITLFSAPDYLQFQATEDRYRNKGTYIVLEPPTFDNPVICSFEAITPIPQANPFYDFEDLSDSDQESGSGAMETSP